MEATTKRNEISKCSLDWPICYLLIIPRAMLHVLSFSYAEIDEISEILFEGSG